MKRIYLEITDACNLNCTFCTQKKGTSFMPLAMIRTILPEIRELTPYLYLHVLGEPLLHPDFEQIMDLCDQLKMQVNLVSNATLLEHHPDLLEHSSLRKLSLSLQALDQLADPTIYFPSIDRLIENPHEKTIELRLLQADRLQKKIIDYYQRLAKHYGLKETGRKGSYLLKKNVYIAFQELFEWPDNEADYDNAYGTCLGGKEMLAILTDGSVTLCCLDGKGINKIGDLTKTKLKDILNEPLYRAHLEGLRNNHLIMPLCRKCRYHERFDGNRG